MRFKKALIFLMFAVCARSSAEVPPDVRKFLSSFPTHMICDGTERHHQLAGTTLKPISPVVIQINELATESPWIEVIAFGASVGYDRFSLASGIKRRWLMRDENTLINFRVIDAQQVIDEQDLLRWRDAGGISVFSKDRVCTTHFRCIDLYNCHARP